MFGQLHDTAIVLQAPRWFNKILPKIVALDNDHVVD